MLAIGMETSARVKICSSKPNRVRQLQGNSLDDHEIIFTCVCNRAKRNIMKETSNISYLFSLHNRKMIIEQVRMFH